MKVTSMLANVFWARRPRRRSAPWLTPEEERGILDARKRLKVRAWWNFLSRWKVWREWRRSENATRPIPFETRIVDYGQAIELCQAAVARGFEYRGWGVWSEVVDVREDSLIWLVGHHERRSGVVESSLMVSHHPSGQLDFEPLNLNRPLIYSYRLDIEKSRWRKLWRATERDKWEIYFTLTAVLGE